MGAISRFRTEGVSWLKGGEGYDGAGSLQPVQKGGGQGGVGKTVGIRLDGVPAGGGGPCFQRTENTFS